MFTTVSSQFSTPGNLPDTSGFSIPFTKTVRDEMRRKRTEGKNRELCKFMQPGVLREELVFHVRNRDRARMLEIKQKWMCVISLNYRLSSRGLDGRGASKASSFIFVVRPNTIVLRNVLSSRHPKWMIISNKKHTSKFWSMIIKWLGQQLSCLPT